MYETQYRSPFLVHDDGTNSPYDHQRIISKLTVWAYFPIINGLYNSYRCPKLR